MSAPVHDQDSTSTSRTPSILPSLHPKQLSIPLPLSAHTILHIHFTRFETSNLIFITTTDPATAGSSSALGSFVYAMPNRVRPSDVLNTTLYSTPSNVDFATRIAKILARRSGKPTYVGCSVSFVGATVEEEMEGVKLTIDGIMKEIEIR